MDDARCVQKVNAAGNVQRHVLSALVPNILILGVPPQSTSKVSALRGGEATDEPAEDLPDAAAEHRLCVCKDGASKQQHSSGSMLLSGTACMAQ